MIRYILITVLFLGMINFSYSQKQICFSYDSAGNQIQASICLNKETGALTKRPPLPDETEETSTTLEEKENITSEDSLPEITLKGAPNPTLGELIVYWYHNEHQSLVRLFISSSDMRILYDNAHINSPSEQLQINMSSYVQGVYYLVGIFSDGTKKTVRIIKK
ncbi:T9SS type A sorting domain-containing protein [Capnocytophaga cynodegmi]|uniref:T9SS type A sorting domain-containing protein n=1 Tax=Capnocytophaga cynodegmi TaxID=28189 RepID=UPI00385B9793